MARMTYVQAIERACEIIETYGFEPEELEGADEAMSRLEELKAQLMKRGSGKKSLTKTQKENVDKKDQIFDLLRDEPDGMTATEVGKAIGESCQRASALLAQMGDPNGKVKGDGRVRREKVGKSIRFFAVV